ncbi:phosphoribosylformylglycinamidine synthase II [Candidatus Omnitrophus magneticus]|uniref:Phosphoribosylformylglycinamidine synthase subunit PurL n=1 Tax=Candidatus Omnitrophus magneticus TaxID=1609969 RepID=A0A0F0CQJ1_9BACT|nr:phosphoribosylformylglycinamidine synthase II [Candidatus Omnitrophus magneticus]
MNYARVEVRCKKDKFDAVSAKLKIDIKDLGIKNVKEVSFIQVYTLEGNFSKDDILKIARGLFTDEIYKEFNYTGGFNPDAKKKACIVEIAYNAGVMDPVTESAVKAIKDMGIYTVEKVTTSKKYILYGGLSQKEAEIIADRLLYNKIIQHKVVSKERKNLVGDNGHSVKETDDTNPSKTVSVNIIGLSEIELEKLSISGQLYLSLEEMKTIQDYFEKQGRNPTDAELETIAQTWSEHCKHKTITSDFDYNGNIVNNLLKTTIMKVTKELDKPWCVSVFKDNAGVIEFDDKYSICFKVETHNHPSALEPYGGSETGVGGVIRDILGTGRGAKPIANTDVFCFGEPSMPAGKVPRGALHPKRVMKGVVSGVRDYGNKMGIPTVNGSVRFDERYIGNPLVFCGTIGIMPKEFAFKKVSSGELIVAVGGKTGRDGIHGATFSSTELTHESETISSTAVQIGNPITEKKVLDTLLKARDARLFTAITDCGAGGFSSAVGEMGEETGAIVYLDKAPLKYHGLKPWEIWVSEAQERMVLSVKPRNLKKLLALFSEEDVEATVIGKFTGDKKLRLFYGKEKVAELEMSFVHQGIIKTLKKAVWTPPIEKKEIPFKQSKDLAGDLIKILSSWNVASKEWIIRQYDHEVQGTSVLKPLVGANNDGPSDAAILQPVFTSKKGIVISNGINTNYGDIDAYWMAASAIDEALRQIVAVGGNLDRTAILDNFSWGNSKKPEQLGALTRACEACYDMAKVFGTPFISGKDSLNNEFNTGKTTISIPPTLLISAVSVIDNIEKTISMDVKEPGNIFYVLGETYNELGGSEYYKMKNALGGALPRVNPVKSLKTMKALSKAVSLGLARSIHDASEGGLAVAIAEMLFAGGLGADINLVNAPKDKEVTREDILLFSESNSRFIVEVQKEKTKEFEKIMQGVKIGKIGEATKKPVLIIKDFSGKKELMNVDINILKTAWKKTIIGVFHDEKN